jgi:hypothetical protein
VLEITEEKQQLVEGVHYSIPRTHFRSKTSEQRTTTEIEMFALELTFEDLTRVVGTQEGQQPQVAKNLASALKKFVEWRRMVMTDIVGRFCVLTFITAGGSISQISGSKDAARSTSPTALRSFQSFDRS